MDPRRDRRLVCRVAAVIAAAPVASCFAQGAGLLPRPDDDRDAGSEIHFLSDASDPNAANELPDVDPHSVRGVDPEHGPFSGGQHAIVRGTGFTSAVRVWFGDEEVEAENVTPIDPRRVQVVVPLGAAGSVDVKVQNADDASTLRMASNAYRYDSFYLSPTSGPLSGGTSITVYGRDTHWDESTTVTVDLAPCDVVALRKPSGQPQELDCRTPPGTPGAKTVRVTTGDETSVLLDAFVFGDSDDGFRGGLSGAALSNRLRVLTLSNATGRPIAGAVVILGDAQTGIQVEHTDANGRVAIEREGLGPGRTVTVAAACHMPVTFVNVPVDTLTVYLAPLESPECTPEGDPPTSRSRVTASSSVIEGELVFPEGGHEFQRAWTNVPVPADPDSQRAAYVFALNRDPRPAFELPDSATAITPDSDGTIGYRFRLQGGLGNMTLYALAGIENRTLVPPLFTAYSMGLVGGVFGEPNETTSEIYVRMDVPLDHALSVTVDGPTVSALGPDRIAASAAVRYGTLGYVILPAGQKDAFLPATVTFDFVGLPPLAGALTGADYVVSATLDTGLSGAPPRSVIGLFSPSPSATSISLDGFLEVPRLDVPGENGSWTGTELALSVAPGGGPADLTLVDVRSDSSTVKWWIVAPGDPTYIGLPDPAQFPEIGLGAGPVSIDVSRARIRSFEYGALGYTDLSYRNWDAYATDTLRAHYE